MASKLNLKSWAVLIAFALPIQTWLVTSCGNSSSPKFKQYFRQGERLYLKHCSNCHQTEGQGLARLYPPLNTSDYMEENFRDVICLIRQGKRGALMVNGVEFNQPMPPLPGLSDLEIAEIATYIYNSWDHQRGLIEVKEASAILSECEARQ